MIDFILWLFDYARMISTATDYRDILKEYLLIRKESNPRYSLRAFAKDLGIPVSNLSNILSGKLGLSKNKAESITEKLNISGLEKNRFIDLVLASDARSKKEKILAQGRLHKYESDDKKELKDDYFKLISEWYYYTILELLTLEGFKSSHRWIAAKLDIAIDEVDEAMSRLVRLGLVKKEGRYYISTGAQLDTSFDIPSLFIKKHNTQILSKASQAILDQDIERRELSTLTIALNAEDIGFVKKEIRIFRNHIDQELMNRSRKKGANRVYSLAIQFFDLLKGDQG